MSSRLMLLLQIDHDDVEGAGANDGEVVASQELERASEQRNSNS